MQLLTILTESLNVLILLLTTYRFILLFRSYTPNSRFQKYVLWVLGTYLFSQLIAVVHKPLQAECVRDRVERTCGVLSEGELYVVGRVLFFVSQAGFSAAGLLYIHTILDRFLVFRPILQFRSFLIPFLRILACIVAVVGYLSNVGFTYAVQSDKPAPWKAISMGGVALFWLGLIISDIWISLVMVITFRRIHAALSPSHPHSPSHSLSHLSSSGTKHRTTSVEDVESGGRESDRPSNPQEEGRRLTALLVVLIVFDILALGSFGLTAVFPSLSTYRFELAQIAESWCGAHYIVGVYFLSRFKASMLVRTPSSPLRPRPRPLTGPVVYSQESGVLTTREGQREEREGGERKWAPPVEWGTVERGPRSNEFEMR